jgi:hypothetical protein
MIQPAQAQYLRDVLGVSEILVPTHFQLTPKSAMVESAGSVQIFSGLPTAFLGLVTDSNWSKEAKVLAQKIGEAVKAPSLSFLESKEIRTAPFETQNISTRNFVIFKTGPQMGEIVQQGGCRFLLTHSLEEMLNGSPEEIQIIKKQVWAHVQKLKSDWEAL